MTSINTNASGQAGVIVAGLQTETTNELVQTERSTDNAILKSRSTSTEAQRAKLLALLQLGPKTTIEARNNGVMMPATRVFELKRVGHIITTELVTQYDDNGFIHPRCARYHLMCKAAESVHGEA